MEISFLSVFISIILAPLAYLIYTSMTRPKNFPPGPMSIPILGSIHHLGEVPSYNVPKLAEKYGDVFSLKAFNYDFVILHGYEANKEMLFDKAKNFCDRPPLKMSSPLKGKSAGIVDGNFGPSWAANRKLFLSIIRGLGVGGVQKIITREASYMMKELEKLTEKEKVIDPKEIINFAVVNVIASFVFGDRYEYDDARMKRLIEINRDFFNISDGYKDPLIFFPLVFPTLSKLWLPKISKKMFALMQNLLDFCAEEVELHKERLDPKSPRDFIDHFLLKIEEHECIGDKPIFSEHELRICLLDMFQAGSDTTTTTLRWAVLYMAGHQDVQEKVQQEIDEVLGFDKEAKYDDRLRMPYTEATIHEVQRFSTIAPGGLFHSPIQDTKLHGYTIPKGTMVAPDLRSCHFQKDKWKDPTKFYPENFLSEDGKFQPNDALMIFGGGLRICVGMAIAKQELFLLFVAIMQKFKILPERDGMKLSFKPVTGFIFSPQHYNYRFVQRD